MRKLKLFLAACAALLCAGNISAQTDVTSTYFTDATFEEETAATSNVSGSKEGNYATMTKWTVTNTGNQGNSWACSAVFSYGTSVQLNGVGVPSAGPNGETTGKALGISVGWQCEVTITQAAKASLPEGMYTLTYYTYNNNTGKPNVNLKFGFKETDNTEHFGSVSSITAGSWIKQEYSFEITKATGGNFTIIAKAVSGGSGDNAKFFIDGISLTSVPYATSDDYSALNSAIATVENKVWGFDAGEYAPYDYVEVIEALATAKAINQGENNSQVTVQNLTNTLNTAMSPNAAEVNAIWDPSFEHEYSTSGNVQPIAWTGTSGHDNATDVRWMWNASGNTGLAATSSSKALFTKFGAFYGQQLGYTLPLNADTYYTIVFKYGGWGDCKKDGYVTMADPATEALTLIPTSNLPLDAVDCNSNTSSWKNYSAIFKTNTAGDYVLGLRKKDESKQSQYAYGDFALRTTTVSEAMDYYNAVLDEVNGDYDAEANGATEKTAFKNAIDANMDGKTVNQIMEAATNLYTLRDAFVAATPHYDALVAEIAYAKTIGVDTDDAETAAAAAETTAATALTATQALKVLEYTTVSAGYGNDVSTLFGAWTVSGYSNKATTGQDYADDGHGYYDQWSANATPSASQTVTLPAGSYVFKVLGRGQVGASESMSVKVGEAEATTVDFQLIGDTGLGTNKTGATSFDADDAAGFANNNAGRGWQWRYVTFTLAKESSVTFTVSGVITDQWVSFDAPTLLCDNATFGTIELITAKAALKTVLDNAATKNTTANVGDAAFQIPAAAVSAFTSVVETAQSVYDNAEATKTTVENATSDLTAAIEAYESVELNAPAAGKTYNIINVSEGYNHSGKALTFKSASAADLSGNSTAMGYNETPGSIYPQGVTFTAVDGVLNGYKLSYTRADGHTVYVGTGVSVGYQSNPSTSQLRPTTDIDKAVVIQVKVTSTADVWNLYNTAASMNIGANDNNDQGFFTKSTFNSMKIQEAANNSVSLNITAANQYGTLILPFDAEIPSGVTAYSVTGVDGNNTLTLETATSFKANKPYVVYAGNGASTTLEGLGAAYTDNSYAEGLLTGVYAATSAPEGSYVLQNLQDKVAFYQVTAGDPITVPAYRAYLTVPANAGAKAFFFPDESTGINAVSALTSGQAEIYSEGGVRQQGLQRGLNIVRTKDGKTVKLMVK